MGTRTAAEVFPPGEFLKEELEARGWSQVELAEILDRPPRLVNEIISGKRAMTPETAKGLGEAFGTSPQLWMNLESQYQLSRVSVAEDSIARKAHLYDRFPVREMIRRGWIQASNNVEVLEQQFMRYFGLMNIEDEPAFAHAARKRHYDSTSMLQLCWMYRAKALAPAVLARRYKESNLERLFEELRNRLEFVESVREVPALLAGAGIRLVIVEALPGAQIDGACFWLNKGAEPVVVLSLLYDRVDNFWHNLWHELDHVAHGEGKSEPILDSSISAQQTTLDQLGDIPDMEIRANTAAAESSIPKEEMDGFIARINPFFSDEAIVGFAKRLKIHPGIVVGQLQRRGLVGWGTHKKHLEKVRSHIVGQALTDGFGITIATGE